MSGLSLSLGLGLGPTAGRRVLSGTTPDGVIFDGFEEPPTVEIISDSVIITGKVKPGYYGKFVYPVEALQANFQYKVNFTANLSGLAQGGALAGFGFGFKQGNKFLLTLLQGQPPQANVTFLESRVSAADLSEYTFTDVDFGEVHADRKIVVKIGCRQTAAIRAITAVTIGGVAAELIPNSSLQGGASDFTTIAAYQVLAPTGASGDIVVTLDGTTNRLGIVVERVIGEIVSAITNEADAPTATLDVPVGGAVSAYALGVSSGVQGVRTAEWDGAAETVEEVVETTIVQTAALAQIPAGGSTPVTCTWSGALAFGTCGLFIVLGPSDPPIPLLEGL